MKKKLEHLIMGLLIIAEIAGLVTIYIGIVLQDSQIPLARFGHDAIYDPQTQKTVMFGGAQDKSGQTLNDIWTYDSTSNLWREIKPTNKPSARTGHTMVYDSFNRKTILFGGWDETFGLRNDIWIYNSQSNQWTEVFPLLISPDRRQSHAMCYDPVYHKVILFGGYGGVSSHLNDTWVYDYSINMWTELHPTNSPSGRYGAKIVYDQINQRVILFGGRAASIMNDTWVYYYGNNTWTKLNTTGSPDTRFGHGMVYDSHNHKVIVFGGNHLGAPDEALEDTWMFEPSNNSWIEVLTQNQPARRMDFSMVYDSTNRKVILFGGWDFDLNIWGSTWAFTYDSNTWIAVKPASRYV